MIVIPEEMKKLLDKAAQDCRCSLATSSNDKPNVIPVGRAWTGDDNKIILPDFYFTKTKANIEKNPQVAISFWETTNYEGYQLKGKAEIDTGPTFEKIKEHYRGKPYTPKGAVVITVEEIYSLKPGDYGKRLA